jgi:RNA polymerase sigma factor (sigma-70 family)
VECGCYLGLHPELALAPKFKGGFTNLIPLEKRALWQRVYAHAKESTIFKHWNDQLSNGLKELIVKAFNGFIKIGLAQKPVLDLEPVEWARTLANGLIYSLQWTLPAKIKAMCDEQKPRIDFANEHFLAYCAWVYWRAPKFIIMQPSGNAPYDPAIAWDREDAEETERHVQGLVGRMLDPVRFKVKDLAGEAYVALACIPPVEKPPAESGRPVAPSQGSRSGQGSDLPTIDPKKSAVQRLIKKIDLSNYFDQAKLTDRQRECISLKHEYGLTVTQIAGRLGISRKTVDEHLEAAERRIQSARMVDRARAQRGRSKPGE